MKGKPLRVRSGECIRWSWRSGQLRLDRCPVSKERHVNMTVELRRRKRRGRKLMCGLCGTKLPAKLVSIDRMLRR